MVIYRNPGLRRRVGCFLVSWVFLLFPQILNAATIWNVSDTPSQAAVTDGRALELGVKFQADVGGNITGLRFYKGAANTGLHVGKLWSRTGALLASATFTNETTSGWQEVQFAAPVAIQAGTTYVASYYSPSGYFALNKGYFATSYYNPPLRALANGADGGNGVYKYGESGFPTLSTNANNYWVDVVFSPSETGDTTPPTVTDFTIPATATSLTISITSFTATDNVGVTGYLVNESSTSPSPTAGGWSATAQTSYTFSTAGTKTLYAWARDAAGNVSTSRSASVTVTTQSTAPEPAGWYTGDMHVHRSCGGSPISMDIMYGTMAAQNLSVMSLLADMGNGEVLDPVVDLPKVNGQDDPISTAGRIIHWDAEWHWDATYFQFPHQALGGHVVALGLTEAYQMWEEYTYPIFEWAHQRNGIAGFAHMQYLDNNIPQTLDCCKPIEYPVEVALGSADFISEDLKGSDSFINAYYRLLNTGFRPGFAAGSDYPCGADVGSLLTYVQVAGGQLTYRNWIEGIAEGRTVISRNGHNEFLVLTVNGNATPGDEIHLTGSGSVPVTVEWRASQSLTGTIELVQNGVVVASVQRSVASGAPASLSATVNFVKSGWVAARRMGSNGHQVHTAAVFVIVDNAPVRTSVTDAEFYVQWMDNLLTKTSPGGEWNSYFPNNLAEAQSRYQQARAVFQQIAVEAGGGVVDTTAPTVTAFTIPATATSLTVPITSFTATDDVGVTGYLVNETATTPSATAGGWSATAQTSYTFSSAGSKTLYAWAKDAAGNVSAGRSASVTITLTSAQYSIWSSAAVPVQAAVTDGQPLEIGLKFQADVGGYITGLRFYKGAANTGTHVGNLWTRTGALLASVTFTNETSSGWQEVQFANPVAIQAGTTYVASYHSPSGYFALDKNYFATDHYNPPLLALANGADGGNGVYKYGTSGFPTSTANSNNYWVDVVFSTSSTGADTTAPTVTAFTIPSTATSLTIPITSFTATDNVGVTGYLVNESSTTPSATAGGWSATAQTSYTFSSAGSKTLYAWAKDAAGNVSAARSASVTITLADTTAPTVTAFTIPSTATSLTVPITSFTATDDIGVTGYLVNESSTSPSATAGGWSATAQTSYTFSTAGSKTLHAWAKDAAGNVSTSRSASVTINLTSTQYSIWSSAAVPVQAAVTDGTPLEIGVKFQADVGGYITGLRFYKGAANSGVHVGNLWTRTGALLTSVTFTNETSSGWQEVQFATPVAILAGTTYVASYHSPSGYFALDKNYFASAYYNPPLRALANGVDGGNGVYKYGTSGFPTSTANSNNYWVDVVFSSSSTGGDTTAPMVTEFTIPATSDSLTVPITSFTATDDVGVTGYLVNESSTIPSATAGGWSATAQTSYTFSTAGSKTLYAWAKDVTGNVSAARSASVTITLSDATAPIVTAVLPPDNALAVSTGTSLNVVFSEAMNASTVNGTTFQLRDSANVTLAATVAYDSQKNTATLTPNNPIPVSTSYTAVIKGGSSGVKDVAGNPLASDYTWGFDSSASSPFGDGPGGPILIITSEADPFSRYFAEILLAEGLNSFAVRDISMVTALLLAQYDVAILGNIPITSAQVTMFSDWVNSGGNLIAMRPDKKLAGLLGLVDTSTTLSEGYLLVNTSSEHGTGIVGQTIQYHGTADRYNLGNAVSVATLYANSTTATSNPAVTLRSVGSNGGQAAAFTFDLARSVVYTRQGNPNWVDQDRDGRPPTRANDLFYGAAAWDPQPDWIDLNKVAIPQADEQQRLLANMIIRMNADKKPLPRFWYFPYDYEAVVIMSGDDHGNLYGGNGTAGRFEAELAASMDGCSLDDWSCIRSSSYLIADYPPGIITDQQAFSYNAEGFEMGVHINTNCSQYTGDMLANYFSQQMYTWRNMFPSLPPQVSHRQHCIAWSGYTLLPEEEVRYGIRLDVNYYYWPSGWAANPGFFTGSGMPMRFTDIDGNLIDVYQATTQMTDESGQTYPYTINTLLDRAIGPEKYYGVFTANMHTDYETSTNYNAIISSAQARGVPVISAKQMLKWLDGRNGSNFSNVTWTNNVLGFTISQGQGAKGLQATVPIPSGREITHVTYNGAPVGYSIDTIKGIEYAVFPALTGSYSVTMNADTTAPVVVGNTPPAGAVEVPTLTAVTVKFSEPMSAITINGNTFQLIHSGGAAISALVTYSGSTYEATLTPAAALENNVRYTAVVRGGTGGVTDLAGNPLQSDYSWSFTTATEASDRYSIWNDATVPSKAAVTDGKAIEVGVKFGVDVNGYITGVRFYKGAANTGLHVGNLWTRTGILLASATFTNETASGWQEVRFATPVAVQAGTTYIASYHSPTGYFALDAGYFATDYYNPPLFALANGEDGGNGVYKYGVSGFPTSTANSSNYWVDVVFTP